MALLPPTSPRLLPRSTWSEAQRVTALLRTETVGGALLLAAAALALVWANSPWRDGYFALRDVTVGPHALHLDLSLATWAADGLLAIFFFVAGLELKHEFVAGTLRDPRKAAVPIVAAACGVAVPAIVYAVVVATSGVGGDAMRGWAIPTATDIAFALAVLAVIGSSLPSGLRAFLLTLAVVDDLIAITIIAIFYTETIAIVPLLMGLLTIAVYAVLAQRYRQFFHLKPAAAWLILLPIGVVAWAFVHASGIHATIAGVLLGFTIPVIHRRRDQVPDTEPGLAEEFEHRFRPLSAGFAVPVFAFFSAGVAIGGAEGFLSALTDPVTIGIIAALVVGKPVGIVLATWLTTRVRGIRLDPSLRWVDITGVGLLAGIGFTVSLLVTELSFTATDPHHDHAKVAILLASVVAAVIASALLASRNRRYRKIAQNDAEDTDNDGIPDVYDRP